MVDLEKLILDIKSYISKYSLDNNLFNNLIIKLYYIHYEMNVTYSNFCDSKIIKTWKDIPLLPISAYEADTPVELSMPTEMPFPGILFKDNKISHYIRDTELYKFNIVNSFPRFVLDEDNLVPWINFIGMVKNNNSSSRYVIEYLSEVFHGHIINNPNKIFDNIQETYGDEVTISIPAVILANQFNYQDIIKMSYLKNEENDSFAKLNLGSKVVQIEEDIINNSMTISNNLMDLFGVNQITKMLITPGITSPMYSIIKKTNIQSCIDKNIEIEPEYFSSPWMKSRIIDIDTGNDVLPGNCGRIALYDLSNLWSCPFILTNYIGKIGPKGGLVFNTTAVENNQ